MGLVEAADTCPVDSLFSLQVPGSSTFDVDPTVNGVLSAPVKGLAFSDMENDP